MVGSLLRESGGKARACFVGNSAIELEDKVRILEDWSASRGDWLSGKPHAELEWAARECIEASAEYLAAAAELGIPYFDLSSNWDAAVDCVVLYLESS